MTPDPTAEIKRIRHQLGADDDFDLDRIFARLHKRQFNSGRSYVRRAPRKPADNHRLHRSGPRHQTEVQAFPGPPGES
ncbi:hypothetical protein Q31b_58630 [Novipirellula aureliae]|uniref:Uncharacterized protein n=1 Tax=Novipirellula aureliae TaxID=2527966 RepID=A0A5C6D4S7_9BACT|nr:hypothetical protein Q31b_58630 [Novipirellula aureliae]